ncbi:AzlD domain-containing protein [Cellulomonas cellasea]|uniref:Branched-subunit amino acid transport protein n=1 Tax=Cellulomonas cellasea TaxID=43670 RepID=A0A7W4UFK6_9CELL|nr:AzlD domain-containing protein [Cellulomonas cellasea]MBB2923277.1 branched-subunit amino acid transport protein [Cellulomonas cellasea]
MTTALLLVVTLVTVASRVLPMTLLPTPHGRAADVLDALPAPLFAALAAVALLGGGELPEPPVLAAAAGALLGALRRSLLLTLGCGLVGFALADLLLG